MAIFHLNVNVVSRGRGQSIVAAAAYRAGARLRDHRYGVVHNYVRRRMNTHAEIMAPAGTPDWVHDREQLWNRVEAAEHRKDSQLARVIDIGLPVELTGAQTLQLVRDYIASVFVARGMIADFGIRHENRDNPCAHILLTLRGVTRDGFGPKERRWNGKASLLEWRAAWADRANHHLARAGHAVRIDHRTLEAQQIELTPARRIGIGRTPAEHDTLPDHLAQRLAEQRLIARANGAAIVEDPTVALRALTHRSPAFTQPDLERFLRHRTEDDVQFEAALEAVLHSPECVELSGAAPARRAPGNAGAPGAAGASGVAGASGAAGAAAAAVAARWFTSRDMIDAAKSLLRRAVSMAGRRTHDVTSHSRAAAAARLMPGARVAARFDYLVSAGAAKAAPAHAADRSDRALLEAALAAWGADALQVIRATPQTLHELEVQWREAREPLTATSVLVIEGAEVIGLKQLERVVGAAERARAKVVLLGAAPSPTACGDETPFWSVLQAIGVDPR